MLRAPVVASPRKRRKKSKPCPQCGVKIPRAAQQHFDCQWLADNPRDGRTRLRPPKVNGYAHSYAPEEPRRYRYRSYFGSL